MAAAKTAIVSSTAKSACRATFQYSTPACWRIMQATGCLTVYTEKVEDNGKRTLFAGHEQKHQGVQRHY
jgi:hypothetical protein